MATTGKPKILTWSEIRGHATEKSCWIVVEDKVLDVTKFLNLHPGGAKLLLDWGGKDATEVFHSLHARSVLDKYTPRLLVGTVEGRSPPPEHPVAGVYGEGIPFGDPYWYNKNFKSPYYTPGHEEFRAKVRAFVEKELRPYVQQWDEAGTYPADLHKKAYEAGVYAAIWPKEYGGTPPQGLDAFHDLILIDELARCGGGGVLWACFLSFGIALPPVLNHGNQYLKDKVCRPVITGEKIMSLAITEPLAGSDVGGLLTTARREGDHYIVSGVKKFITSGTKAHFFTTAVRTGGPGSRGVSLVLIERDMPGVSVRRLKTQGWWTSGTALVIFENVRVPVKNLIGEENQGFKMIAENFNHERFVLAAQGNRWARTCLEDAIRFARIRKTFKKRLIDHDVIRHKIAEMTRRVESTHALLEQVAYQMKHGVPHSVLRGPIALLKVQASKTFEYCAREAAQILGGNAYTRSGHGERVERLYREVRVNAIGGGSEEILRALAMKEALL